MKKNYKILGFLLVFAFMLNFAIPAFATDAQNSTGGTTGSTANNPKTALKACRVAYNSSLKENGLNFSKAKKDANDAYHTAISVASDALKAALAAATDKAGKAAARKTYRDALKPARQAKNEAVQTARETMLIAEKSAQTDFQTCKNAISK